MQEINTQNVIIFVVDKTANKGVLSTFLNEIKDGLDKKDNDVFLYAPSFIKIRNEKSYSKLEVISQLTKFLDDVN